MSICRPQFLRRRFREIKRNALQLIGDPANPSAL
jgi:hypothetical protein